MSEPAGAPVTTRALLRELQAGLDEAVASYDGHCREHGCRAVACTEAARLDARAAGAQGRLAMTRFLNEPDG